MVQEKRSSAISIVIGIVVTGVVAAGSYFLGFYHSSRNFHFPSLSLPTRQMVTTPAPSLQNTLNPCQNEKLGVTLTVPTGWTCNSDKISDTQSSISLSSSFFNITISNASRNEFCVSNPSVYGYDPNCIVTSFYSTPSISTAIYTYQGKNKEIYGNVLNANNKPGTPVPWISIKYQNMENQTLLEIQKNELVKVLDSISPL